jgi:hypothetical protein
VPDLGPLKAVTDFGLALVALAFVSFFGYRLLREYVDSLKDRNKQLTAERDEAIEGWKGATAAIERWSDLEEARQREARR